MSSQGEDIDREGESKGKLLRCEADGGSLSTGLDTRRIWLGCSGLTVGCSTSTEVDCKFKNRRDTGFPRTETRGLIYMENNQQDKGNKRSRVGLPTVPYTVTTICNTAGLRSELYHNPYHIP